MLLALLHDCVWVVYMEVRGVSVAFGPTPGMPWLLQPALLSRCEGHRCLRSSGTPRPKSLSSLRGYRVDPLVLAQCPTWALTLTGDWIKSGAEDGFWWCMKVYGSLRVWRVWCVWCVWCDWCVLTRTLLWQYDAVWIRAGLYSMAVRRALDMRLAIFSRRSEGLHWSANIKNRQLARNISKQHCRHVSFAFV